MPVSFEQAYAGPWRYGELQDALAVHYRNPALPRGSHLLLTAIVKRIDLATGEARVTDDRMVKECKWKSDRSVRRNREPLIENDVLARTGGSWGVSSVYRLVHGPEWVASRLVLIRQQDKEDRAKAIEASDQRYRTLRAKRANKSTASNRTESRTLPDNSDRLPDRNVRPLLSKKAIIEREVIGHSSDQDPFLSFVISAPAAPWLTTAERTRGYQSLVALVDAVAAEARLPPTELRRRLAPQAVLLAIAVAEFPGDEEHVALPAVRKAAGLDTGKAIAALRRSPRVAEAREWFFAEVHALEQFAGLSPELAQQLATGRARQRYPDLARPAAGHRRLMS